MSKTALALRHVAFEDLGVFAPALAARGYDVRYGDAGCGPIPDEAIQACDLLVVLGAPIGVYELDEYPFLVDELAAIRRRLQAEKPTLGVCLGAQLMAAALGAQVGPGPGKEIGYAPLTLTDAGRASPLGELAGLPVLHWHGDTFALPAGAVGLAATPLCPHQAFSLGANALALQFHCEVDPVMFERWLIGHTVELGKAKIDPRVLREQAARLGAATAQAGRRVLESWLAGLSA